MDLVPLRIRIGLKQGRTHDYPPFNTLPASLRDGMDWANFIDQYGGMHYDQCYGHDDSTADSPCGCWLSMVMVPREFATAAVDRWPDRCSIMSESQARQFYNDRCHVRDSEVIDDLPALQSIASRRVLGIEDDAEVVNALDPEHPALGRRRNRRKKFDDFVSTYGINVVGVHRRRRQR